MKNETTVIIPAFNRPEYLKKAIDSVLSQRYKDFELIVVDDGSETDIKNMLTSFDKHIIYIRQDNKGPAGARNTGIKHANGKFIAFLDSDDWWDKDKLLIQINEMKKNPQFLISHTQEIWYQNSKLLNQKKKHKKYHGFIFDKCLPICAVSMSTAVIRTELFDHVGLFDETLPCCEDYDFWLRTSSGFAFLLIDKPLTLKEGGRGDQVSSIHKIGMDKYRIRAIEKIICSENILNNNQKNLAVKELEKKCHIYAKGCIKHGKIKQAEQYAKLLEKYKSR